MSLTCPSQTSNHAYKSKSSCGEFTKKTWFQQPQKQTSSSLPSLACTVCHFETVLDSVWRTVKGLSNAATNGEREKEKRGRNPFEVLLLVCSSSSCVCASIHQIWGSPHLIPLSHSGRFFPFLFFPISSEILSPQRFPILVAFFVAVPLKLGVLRHSFFFGEEKNKHQIGKRCAARNSDGAQASQIECKERVKY